MCCYCFSCLKKKMLKLAQEKDCGQLLMWMKSICNHLYWVAVSTPDGHGEMMLETWLSLTNHLHNVHQHPGSLFPQCQHAPLPEGERQKKWLKPGAFCLCVNSMCNTASKC